VSQQIIRALAVKLTAAEQGQLGRAPTGNPEAYDLALRGQDERRRTTREANVQARRLFVKAMDLDPQYARAYVELSWAHLQSWQFGWSADPDSLERAQDLAKSGALSPGLSMEASSLRAPGGRAAGDARNSPLPRCLRWPHTCASIRPAKCWARGMCDPLDCGTRTKNRQPGSSPKHGREPMFTPGP
jgi:hypothetical protein